MDTTTLAVFWEGFASTSGNFIFGDQRFWILLAQTVIVLSIIGVLFVAVTKAAKRLTRKR